MDGWYGVKRDTVSERGGTLSCFPTQRQVRESLPVGLSYQRRLFLSDALLQGITGACAEGFISGTSMGPVSVSEKRLAVEGRPFSISEDSGTETWGQPIRRLVWNSIKPD
jgi:hypothetical protein